MDAGDSSTLLAREPPLIVEMKRFGEDVREFRVKRPLRASALEGTAAAAVVLLMVVHLLARSVFPLGWVVAFVVTASLFVIYSRLNSVVEESLLVVQELGVQLTTTYFSGKKISTFIDKDKIKAVLINEGITMWTVIFYLVIQRHDKDDLVLAFSTLFPDLASLLQIYKGTRAALYGDPE